MIKLTFTCVVLYSAVVAVSSRNVAEYDNQNLVRARRQAVCLVELGEGESGASDDPIQTICDIIAEVKDLLDNCEPPE